MKKILNIYEAIVDNCMLDSRYITNATWSEFGVEGFGSLVTENCGDRLKASLVNRKGAIVFEKYFFKQECAAIAA